MVPPVVAIKPKKRVWPETKLKKATKRRQLLEKHTPRWTLEDSSQQKVAHTIRRPEPTEKATERLAKKTSWIQEAVEKVLEGQKPIKIKLRRQDQEPENFIQKIHQETTKEDVKYEIIYTIEKQNVIVKLSIEEWENCDDRGNVWSRY